MNEYEINKAISKISTWGKFTGIAFMVLGAINAFFGLFAYVIGAIPGVLMIVLGYFLWKAGQDAARLKEVYDENVQGSLFKNIGTYLQIQGIMIIVSIVFFVLMLLLFGAIFATLISEYGL